MNDSYLYKLLESKTTTEILSHLFEVSQNREIPIISIRYYRHRVRHGEEQLVSVDCFGHDDHTSTLIRLGHIKKLRFIDESVQTNGYFDVILQSSPHPIVFQIDPSMESPGVHTIQHEPVQYCELQDDECDDFLGPGSERPPWVDIPLRMAGRALGKLSCSLSIGRMGRDQKVPPALLPKLMEFQEYANIATPFLESLRSLDVNSPLEEAGRSIFSTFNYESLYEYCTTSLRYIKPFNYEAADIFIVSRDTLKYYSSTAIQDDGEFLILRGSSNNTALVNREYYRKEIKPREWSKEPSEDGKGLTPWVWRTRNPLRLSYDPHDLGFTRQIRAYEEDPTKLSWAKKITPVGQIRSLLIVPIHKPIIIHKLDHARKDRKVIGVIRFVNKVGDEAISPREEVLLSRIADRCIGPKIMSLKHEIISKKLVRNLEKVTVFRLDSTPPLKGESPAPDFRRILNETIEAFFPHEGKTFLLNLVTAAKQGSFGPQAERFRSEIIRDDLGYGIQFNGEAGELELNGSLTNFVINSNRDYVFINDLDYAEREGAYHRLGDGIMCVLASRIHYGGNNYGAFIILSNQYDIIPAVYGKLVHVLATQIGMLYARREVLDFSVCINGLKHDGISALNRIRAGLVDLRGQLDQTKYNHYNDVVDFWGHAISVHCRTGPPTPAEVFNQSSDPINILRCANLSIDQAWAEVGQGSGNLPRVVVEIDENLEAAVWESCLTVCMFNLLKNAWENSAETSPVSLKAWVEKQKLVVQVTNWIAHANADRLRKVDRSLGEGLPTNHPVPWRQTETSGIGLRLVRRLADWHRVPCIASSSGYRKGDLVRSTAPVPEDESLVAITFTLSLPSCELREGLRHVPE